MADVNVTVQQVTQTVHITRTEQQAAPDPLNPANVTISQTRTQLQSAGTPIQQTTTVYRQGPPGPPGEATGNVVRTAGANLSAIRAVYEGTDGKVRYATNTDPTTATKTIGVTTSAALQDDEIGVCLTGEIEDNSLSLTPGPLYLGTNGALTSTPPSTGVLLRVGTALTTGRLVVNVQQPIIRS